MNRHLENSNRAGIDEFDSYDLRPGRVERVDDKAGFDRFEFRAVRFQFKPNGFVGRTDDIHDDGRASAADIQQFAPAFFLRAVFEPGQPRASLAGRKALPETTFVKTLEDLVE